MDWNQNRRKVWVDGIMARFKELNANRRRLAKVEILSGKSTGVVVLNIPAFFGDKPKKVSDFKSAFECGEAYSLKLQSKGWTMIGRGAYSDILVKGNSNKVLKVTRRLDSWIDYIEWAADKGYMGTFAPMVYSYKLIDGSTEPFSVAVVERMKETINEVDQCEDASLYEPLMWRYAARDNILAGVFLDEMSPGLAKFTKELYTTWSGQLDMHMQNCMVRENGTFCVTDPVSGAKQSTKKRIKAREFTLAA